MRAATVTTHDPHGKPKRLYVRALRSDACDILRQRGELADCWQARVPTAAGNEIDKRSLYEELQQLPEYRRGQGRKHSLATVLAVYLLAMLSNMRGPVAAAEDRKNALVVKYCSWVVGSVEWSVSTREQRV